MTGPSPVRPTNRGVPVGVFGEAVVIRGQRGQQWLLLVVRRCPGCNKTHVHLAPVGATVVRREAPCRGGPYRVHPVDRSVR